MNRSFQCLNTQRVLLDYTSFNTEDLNPLFPSHSRACENLYYKEEFSIKFYCINYNNKDSHIKQYSWNNIPDQVIIPAITREAEILHFMTVHKAGSLKLYGEYKTNKKYGLVIERYSSQFSDELNIFRGRKITLTNQEFLKIAIDMVSPLEFMEMNQLVYRVVNPEGFCFVDHTLKLSDFSAADSIEKAGSRGLIPNNGYMAPELSNDNSSSYDPVKSDVYSLGIVLLETIIGKPLEGKIKEQVECINDFWVKDIIHEMINEQPDERPSFIELKAYLNEVREYFNNGNTLGSYL